MCSSVGVKRKLNGTDSGRGDRDRHRLTIKNLLILSGAPAHAPCGAEPAIKLSDEPTDERAPGPRHPLRPGLRDTQPVRRPDQPSLLKPSDRRRGRGLREREPLRELADGAVGKQRDCDQNLKRVGLKVTEPSSWTFALIDASHERGRLDQEQKTCLVSAVRVVM